jgi:hypothetical protein
MEIPPPSDHRAYRDGVGLGPKRGKQNAGVSASYCYAIDKSRGIAR